MSITIVKKKRNTPMSGPGRYEEFRLQGYIDARDGVFHPEGYSKGMPRNAYSYGKEQWVAEQEKEK